MSAVFSERELAYLSSQRLGRLATTGPDGSPHVVPVGYRLNEDATFDILGPNMAASRKYKDLGRDDRFAFVVDDVTPPEETDFRPGVGRGVEVRGRAELLPAGGEAAGEVIRLHPAQVLSWHVDPARRPITVLADRGGRL